MFDLRYHVASLAAVFVALAVGILLGVAISGEVSDAQRSLDEGERSRLQADLDDATRQAEAAREQGAATSNLLEDVYPALMEDMLRGKRFALLFLGPVDGDLRSSVERTLTDADSGSPARLIALDLPVDPRGLDDFLAGNELLADYADGGDFGALGRDLGRELIAGEGEQQLWQAVSGELVEERSGTESEPVDGAIVVYSWTPPTDGADQQPIQATQTLLDGLLGGLGDAGLPVVGVETSSETDSTIDLYRERGSSSVDDVDQAAGRIALAFLLAGGTPGHYGVKDSASDGVAPPIDSVPPVGS